MEVMVAAWFAWQSWSYWSSVQWLELRDRCTSNHHRHHPFTTSSRHRNPFGVSFKSFIYGIGKPARSPHPFPLLVIHLPLDPRQTLIINHHCWKGPSLLFGLSNWNYNCQLNPCVHLTNSIRSGWLVEWEHAMRLLWFIRCILCPMALAGVLEWVECLSGDHSPVITTGPNWTINYSSLGSFSLYCFVWEMDALADRSSLPGMGI